MTEDSKLPCNVNTLIVTKWHTMSPVTIALLHQAPMNVRSQNTEPRPVAFCEVKRIETLEDIAL